VIPDVELTPEERDRIVESWAQKVVGRGLETPAILFLEMHKPLSFIASQAVIVGSPLAAPFFGFENIHRFSKILEDRKNVELLIQRIEELAAERDNSPKPVATAVSQEGIKK
jgi:hypothetical protein